MTDGQEPAKRADAKTEGHEHEEELARLEEEAQVTAPIHGDPSLDPTEGPIWKVSKLVGYGDGDGYDAMMGVDHMVMGRVDATRELAADSRTEGTPMELDPFESLLNDDVGFGDLVADVEGSGDMFGSDWTSELQLGEGEGL